MKTVEQLAREAGPLISTPFDKWCENFHDLAIAQYRESLLAGVGEPVAYRTEDSSNGVNVWLFKKTAVKYQDPPDALYTADQMAAAVLRERERIAELVEGEDVQHPKYIAAAIRGAAMRIKFDLRLSLAIACYVGNTVGWVTYFIVKAITGGQL